MLKKYCLSQLILLLSFLSLHSQPENFHFNVTTLGGYTSAGTVPFWLRSNNFGSVPLDNASLSLIGSVHKEYDTQKPGIFDWGVGVEGRANLGKKSNFNIIEGYGKIRISVFEIKAGRSREIMGLCDTSLTSGAFSVAGNSLGIPKVEISIPDFYTLPFFGHLFAFKGNYAHGWIGNTDVKLLSTERTMLTTYMHQKSLYGRFGKKEWKWKLYGGFNHQVFWGSEKSYYSPYLTLSPFEVYLYVVAGRPYGTDNIPYSKIGNQLGSIDLGFEYNIRNVKILAYRQFVYDIGAMYHLANLRDGLNGLSFTNMSVINNGFRWKKILVEFFYTKNQGGELWSPYSPSGDENYYNNDQYIEGWSYKKIGIGNPFIGTRDYIREGLPADPRDYFINNRVVVLHFGSECSVREWDFMLKASYSLNYGTFGTDEVGHTLGKIRTLPRYGIFEETKQFSAFMEGSRTLNNGFRVGLVTAFDKGNLYYDSFGLIASLVKSF